MLAAPFLIRNLCNVLRKGKKGYRKGLWTDPHRKKTCCWILSRKTANFFQKSIVLRDWLMLLEGNGLEHLGVSRCPFLIPGHDAELQVRIHRLGAKTSLVIAGLIPKSALDDMLAGR